MSNPLRAPSNPLMSSLIHGRNGVTLLETVSPSSVPLYALSILLCTVLTLSISLFALYRPLYPLDTLFRNV